MQPPRQRTLAAVSAPAEEKRAPNWEEHTQQSNWAQGWPTHGTETSPNRTHNNAQGDHEVRAVQQMRCTASKPLANKPPPSRYEVPANSTRVPGGACHGGGNKAVTSQPRTGQSTSYGDVKSTYGGAGGWERSGCGKGAPKSANRQREEQHKHIGCGSHTRRGEGEHNRQGGGV